MRMERGLYNNTARSRSDCSRLRSRNLARRDRAQHASLAACGPAEIFALSPRRAPVLSYNGEIPLTIYREGQTDREQTEREREREKERERAGEWSMRFLFVSFASVVPVPVKGHNNTIRNLNVTL